MFQSCHIWLHLIHKAGYVCKDYETILSKILFSCSISKHSGKGTFVLFFLRGYIMVPRTQLLEAFCLQTYTVNIWVVLVYCTKHKRSSCRTHLDTRSWKWKNQHSDPTLKMLTMALLDPWRSIYTCPLPAVSILLGQIHHSEHKCMHTVALDV